MAKTRVYELAKELGLANKEVIELCAQLGMEDKRSHSNSLTDDEADRIRRSVIRKAVSDKEEVRQVETDGSTTIVRRKGDIIRRRRKAEEEVVEEAKIDLSSVPPPAAAFEEEPRDFRTEVQARKDALARADALFPEESETEGAIAEQVERAGAAEAAVELVPDELAAEVPPAVGEPAEGEVVGMVEAETAEPGEMAEEEVSDQLSGEEGLAIEEGEVEEEEEEASLEELRRKHLVRAPKVLGKIDLPKVVPLTTKEHAKAPAKAHAKKRVEETVEEPEFEAGGGKRGRPGRKKAAPFDSEFGAGRQRRTRKQILKKDELLDYGTERDAWATRRDKKKKAGKTEPRKGPEITTPRASKMVVKIDGQISVGELAKSMGVKVSEVIAQLMGMGVMATINELLDFETATVIADELGFTTVNTGHDELEFIAALREGDVEEDLEPRPPVVTIMGHVDHGKTSLLDKVRQTQVAESEAGGITQHIGAYNVVLPSGGSVTFVDTPGHAAFTAMRSRGAQITDVVVLVVAADDGVMPQTVEAIHHAKAAEVPIVVAINKIDKEGANTDRVTTHLGEHGLIPEGWGGDTIIVPVSAHTGEGVETLLENLYLQAEILELKANPNRKAIGRVVEAALDRGRGPVMTVLVQSGTLRKGDPFFAGAASGKVRALVSDDGRNLEEAGPGMPVEVVGASSAAIAGDDFFVVSSESEAREIAEQRYRRLRQHELSAKKVVGVGAPLSLESFSDLVKQGEVKTLPLIVKADVQGSAEAVKESLEQIGEETVEVKIIHSGVGAVTENDIQLAHASNAVIVAFNVRYDSRARELAEEVGVDIRFFRVIYELIDSVKAAVKGMLAPTFEEKTLGRVEVRQTFKVPKLGVVAGSYVIDGFVQRGALVRLLRDERVVYEGKMASLRRFKDDVKEVQTGYECGIGIEGYSDIHDGDIIEVYKIEEVRP